MLDIVDTIRLMYKININVQQKIYINVQHFYINVQHFYIKAHHYTTMYNIFTTIYTWCNLLLGPPTRRGVPPVPCPHDRRSISLCPTGAATRRFLIAITVVVVVVVVARKE